MLSRFLVATAVILTLGSGTPLAAQAADAQTLDVRAGPRIDSSVSGIRRPAQPAAAEPIHQRRGAPARSQAATLMIVGAAALVVGALVGGTGGDLLMLGGAVVGLVGLYRYLQ